MRLHSEEQDGPRRGSLQTTEELLIHGQSERGGKGFWDAVQLERDPTSRWNAGIASEFRSTG
jgi:hypothetical protein